MQCRRRLRHPLAAHEPTLKRGGTDGILLLDQVLVRLVEDRPHAATSGAKPSLCFCRGVILDCG